MPKNTNILLIRHAEKPTEKGNINLSPAGQARAWAYVSYFQNFKISSQTIKLSYLFATAQSSQSNRPYQTIKPLADQLGLEINQQYDNNSKSIEALANALLSKKTFDNANILVCWHHQELLHLAKLLGATEHDLPKNWPPNTFGWIIQLSFDNNGKLSQTLLVKEQLMYTDVENSFWQKLRNQWR